MSEKQELETAKPAIIVGFGQGRVVIAKGTYGEFPAVFLAEARIPGDVGSSASRENLPKESLVPGEIVLRFPTEDQAARVESALLNEPDLAAENTRLREALGAIAEIAGKIPDDILCSATGANDARYRGGLVCSARDIARFALNGGDK